MSSIIDFYLAPDDAAAAGGPGDGESAEYGNFDAYTALFEWEALLTGRDAMELIESDDSPDVGDLVFRARGELVTALAEASPERLAWVTREWIAGDEAGVEDEELALELVTEVAGLARTARATGRHLYLQVS
ncbi:hypothetical protein [Actinoplanes aureus]|uniref:DUF1877 family protein n=1 Tax=Actinoplanes aureus TaxID=2792083 RepID=A0A931CJF6_9ACTN|nr:hypothetical protein [Actinoplanes aureus]MBG0567288.1 hypothetical protein [Actinoplanes aureus]